MLGTAVLLATLIGGQTAGAGPAQPHLQPFSDYIGTWCHEGEVLEDGPNARKGEKVKACLSWRWLYDGAAVEWEWVWSFPDKTAGTKGIFMWDPKVGKVVGRGIAENGTNILVEGRLHDGVRFGVTMIPREGAKSTHTEHYMLKDNVLVGNFTDRGDRPDLGPVEFHRVDCATVVESGAPEKWLRLCVGEWKASGSDGSDFKVVGKPLLDGKAVMFDAVTATGEKIIGILGWEPDKKRLVETGYGTAGYYYQFTYTEITDEHLKGRYVERTADGANLEGDWHVWRTGDDVLEWKFDGTKDGQAHSFTGKHTRVK